ncbi:hypothetical protein ACVRZD_08605 [Streptococcus hongkongensis]
MSHYLMEPVFKGYKIGDETKTKSRAKTIEQNKKQQRLTRLKKLRKRGK